MELGFLQDHGPHSGQGGLGGGARAERKPRFHSPSRGTCILLEEWHPFRISPKWILLHESTVYPSACNSGDMGSIPRSGRSPGERNGYALQYSFLDNSMDRGDRRATVHGVAAPTGLWCCVPSVFSLPNGQWSFKYATLTVSPPL